MNDETLFPLGERKPLPEPDTGAPRISRPVRDQVEFHFEHLDSMITDDHAVRIVWGFVEKSDLSELTRTIRSTEGRAGRPAIDPRVFLALWLYATLDGIGSARALDKLCSDHLVYRWICGGVSVNYHSLADFRSNSGEVLDDLLVEMVATLRAQNLVQLNRVAHDGVRVRANAGRGSFRRKDRLDELLAEAEAQVLALKQELHENPNASDERRKAARERATRERVEKLKAALAQYPSVKKKKKREKEDARVSTTDADARYMRMADGGFRSAYNVQFTTDPTTQIVVGVAISNSGSDEGQLLPAVEKQKAQYGEAPDEILADGGYSKKEDIEKIATEHRCLTYAPVPKRKQAKVKRIRKSRMDSALVVEWKTRMETDEAKAIYKIRAQTECVHAQARNRGLQQFPVRGEKKALAVALLHALAQNIMQTAYLKKKAA